MKRILWLAALAFLVTLPLEAGNPDPRPVDVPSGKIILKGPNDHPVKEHYLVALKDDVDPDPIIKKLKSSKIEFTYRQALTGFAGQISEEDLRTLVELEEVLWIEEDAEVHEHEVQQAGATWGLDRVDQRFLPIDGSYWYYPVFASNLPTFFTAHAYVIDGGIAQHAGFGGRYLFGPGQGFSVITDGFGIFPCATNGHGTHVAGTIGSTVYGVAKQVALHSVRVLDCNGNGTLGGVVAGVDWVRANHVKPAVANLSLGGAVSPTLNTAIDNLAGAGVFVAVSAGNENADACGVSPASAAQAFTVGATNSADQKSVFFSGASNFGPCVDLFAPGSAITSLWVGGATAVLDGTSMASPHVAGTAALHLAEYPVATVAQVRQEILATATPGVLVGNLGTGSPNLLLDARLGSLMASFSGTLSQFQQQVLPLATAYFARGNGPHEALLTSTSPGANFNLELWKLNPATGVSNVVVTSSSASSTERILRHDTGDSYYFWVVVNMGSATGTYTLRTSQP